MTPICKTTLTLLKAIFLCSLDCRLNLTLTFMARLSCYITIGIHLSPGNGWVNCLYRRTTYFTYGILDIKLTLTGKVSCLVKDTIRTGKLRVWLTSSFLPAIKQVLELPFILLLGPYCSWLYPVDASPWYLLFLFVVYIIKFPCKLWTLPYNYEQYWDYPCLPSPSAIYTVQTTVFMGDVYY